MREFDEELKELKDKGLLRKPVYLELSNNAKIFINGQRYINFSSNDYLGLSGHPEIIQAAVAAFRKYGFGSGSSRLLSGSYVPHKKLEDRIAKFKRTKAALLFSTGYSANTGIIPAVVGTGDTVLSDEFNHASIVDGARLSGAKIRIYRHRDVNHLEDLLKRSCRQVGANKNERIIPPNPPFPLPCGNKEGGKGGRGDYQSGKSSLSKRGKIKRRIIITDTVFSMDGDIAPLKDIVFLSKKYNALLMIDDAHGAGVLGKTGRGGLEHFGIKSADIIQMGTLSKAFGCFGGFVAGSRHLTDFLINRARSFIYSTSLPPAMVEACIKAIDIVDFSSHNMRKRLWKNRQRLYLGLKSLDYDILNSETPIIPILAGNVVNAIKTGNYLRRKRIFAPAIRPPTVPEGKCRIRFSVTAAHTDDDIDMVLESLKKFKLKT